jgi:hypothetical protein
MQCDAPAVTLGLTSITRRVLSRTSTSVDGESAERSAADVPAFMPFVAYEAYLLVAASIMLRPLGIGEGGVE